MADGAARSRRRHDISGRDTEKESSSVEESISCPSCRTVHVLPQGGVAAFQKNFYIHDDNEDNEARSSTNLTTQNVTQLQTKANEQVKVMEAVTSRLSDDVIELQHQRKNVEKEIQQRYENGLRQLAEARDRSLSSLAEAADQVSDKLESESSTALITLTSLRQLAQEDVSKRLVSASSDEEQQTALLSDAAIRHFGQRARGRERPSVVFLYPGAQNENKNKPAQCFSDFMGTVCLADGSSARPGARVTCQDIGNATPQRRTTLCSSETTEVTKLRHQFAALQEENTRLQGNVEASKAQMKALKTEVTKMATAFKRLETDVADTQAGLISVQKAAAGTRDDLSSAKEENVQGFTQVGNRISSVERSMDNLQSSVKDVDILKSKLLQKFEKIEHPVFFNAYLEDHKTLRAGQTLFLKEVQANEGNGYNPKNGQFNAPVSGTYLFLFTTRPDADTGCLEKSDLHCRFDICQGDEMLATAWCRSSMTSTAHVVVRLTAGEEVHVRANLVFPRSTFRGFEFTRFCGLLIQPDL